MDLLRKKFKGFRRRFPNLYSIVIGAAVVLFVRGVIGLADLFLFPSYEVLSYGVSIAIGLAILYLNDFKLKELEK
jgi:hypothetical protein